MTENNLPEKRPLTLPVKGIPESLPNFKLRPVVSLTGTGLLIAGGVVFAVSGIGFFSTLALLLGSLTLITGALLRRSQNPLDALDQVETPELQRIREIKRYVSKAQYLENVGDLGEKAANQLTQISDRFKTFQKLLPLKFNQGEITFSRYHSAGEQTYLAILDGLNQIATTLHAINTMDPKSQGERKQLRERQLEQLDSLFALNEKALTEFDRVSIALAETQTRAGESSLGLDDAMTQLTELANRAKKYAKK